MQTTSQPYCPISWHEDLFSHLLVDFRPEADPVEQESTGSLVLKTPEIELLANIKCWHGFRTISMNWFYNHMHQKNRDKKKTEKETKILQSCVRSGLEVDGMVMQHSSAINSCTWPL